MECVPKEKNAYLDMLFLRKRELRIAHIMRGDSAGWGFFVALTMSTKRYARTICMASALKDPIVTKSM
jgi:alpha-D-ribose 1-methylphosphonate 5-triphosphate synthase subunit PhnI